MTFILRDAKQSEAALLNQLGIRLYTHHLQHYWDSKDEMNEYLQQEYSLHTIQHSLNDPAVSWYIVESSTPVGFLKVTWRCHIPGTRQEGTLLNKLYLSPDETGKNYGRQILDDIAEKARERGNDYLWLEVHEHNKRARQFYEKQGMVFIQDFFHKTSTSDVKVHILGKNL